MALTASNTITCDNIKVNWNAVKEEGLDNNRFFPSIEEVECTPFEDIKVPKCKDKEQIFICIICEYETKSLPKIHTHLKTHEKCESCKYQSASKSDLQNHLFTCHIAVSCDLCGLKLKYDLNSVHAHIIIHHIPKVIEKEWQRCKFCSFKSRSKKLFDKHQVEICKVLENQDSKESYEEYNNISSPFENNRLDIEDINFFKCNTCDYKTDSQKKLSNHLKIHKEKKHTCEVCKLKFVFKAQLLQHAKIHLPKEQVTILTCEQCSFETRYKKSLSDHLLLHKDPGQIDYFNCHLCEYKCIKKYNLSIHLLTHKSEGEVPVLKCDSCLYETKFKMRLRRHVKLKHMSLEQEEKVGKRSKVEGMPHRKYNRINKRCFPQKRLGINKSAEGFVCDICGLKTRYKGSLKTHSLVHKSPEELSMFRCSYNCGFETKLKGTLKVHELTHKDPNEITMHSCHLCDFRNRKKYNLKMHLLTHKNSDEVEMIKCKGCDYETKFKSYMKAHLKKKHLMTKVKGE